MTDIHVRLAVAWWFPWIVRALRVLVMVGGVRGYRRAVLILDRVVGRAITVKVVP